MKKSFHLLPLLALVFITGNAVAALFTVTTNYSVGTTPSSVALANLRGKGLYRDLVTANTADDSVTVRLCLDNGYFGQALSYPVDDGPVSVKYGDVNSDKQDDLITANYATNTISVLRNLGVGANFAPATNYTVGSSANPGPIDVAVGDLNGDGKLDIVSANFADNSVSVLTNLGNGTYGTAVDYAVGNGPSAVFVLDMNGDGKADIIVANKTDGTVSILPGNGDGTFAALQTINYASGGDPQPVSLVCRDVDADNVSDIVVVNNNEQTVSVLIGDSSGGNWVLHRQDDYVTGLDPVSVVVRDLNHDGIVDFGAVSAFDETFEVFLGDGSGFFLSDSIYVTGQNPTSAAASNFNSDEAADVVIANADDNDVSVLVYTAPLAYNQTISLNEDVPKSFGLRGTIVNGSVLVFLTNSAPAHGTLTLAGSNVLYSPDADYFGADSFQFVSIYSGGSLTSATATVTLNVASVNDAPSFTLTTNYVAILEDAPATNVPGFIASTNVGPANEAGQTVAYVVATTNRADFTITPRVSNAGVMTFRPNVNHTGLKELTIFARDNGGTLRSGTNYSAVQKFYVEILPNPVKSLRGSFNGLYYDTNFVDVPSSGFFTFTIGALGNFTGRLTSDTGRDGFSGRFDPTGYASVDVQRHSGSPITLTMQLDISGGSDRVLGSATDGSWTADLQGDRAVLNATTNPAAQQGRYTFVLPGENNVSGVPAGDSFAYVNVTRAGAVSVNGRLADGTSFSQSVPLSKNGLLPLYATLYNYRGVVVGWLQFTNLADTDLDGDVFWGKTAFTSPFYPGGFGLDTYTVGSTYVYTSGIPIVAITNVALVTQGGDLTTSPFVVYGTFGDNNVGAFTNGSSITVTTPTSGGVTGNFRHPDLTNAVKRMTGVALQKQGQLRGYFLGPTESGSFVITNR